MTMYSSHGCSYNTTWREYTPLWPMGLRLLQQPHYYIGHAMDVRHCVGSSTIKMGLFFYVLDQWCIILSVSAMNLFVFLHHWKTMCEFTVDKQQLPSVCSQCHGTYLSDLHIHFVILQTFHNGIVFCIFDNRRCVPMDTWFFSKLSFQTFIGPGSNLYWPRISPLIHSPKVLVDACVSIFSNVSMALTGEMRMDEGGFVWRLLGSPVFTAASWGLFYLGS